VELSAATASPRNFTGNCKVNFYVLLRLLRARKMHDVSFLITGFYSEKFFPDTKGIEILSRSIYLRIKNKKIKN